MSPELTDKLRQEFPKIFVSHVYIGCGDGWYELLRELCIEIQKTDIKIEATYIKEKLGGLRFGYRYLSYPNVTEQEIKIVQDLVMEAENKSDHVCEDCGKPGKLRDELSWHRTLCDACRTNIDIRYIIE